MQAPLIFYTALHLAGPDLTAESFRAGLFRFPSGATHPTDLHISWGLTTSGRPPTSSAATTRRRSGGTRRPRASTRSATTGTGLWEYSRDGKRYLPGQWPSGEPDVFNPATSITQFPTLPPADRPPSYPSPAK